MANVKTTHGIHDTRIALAQRSRASASSLNTNFQTPIIGSTQRLESTRYSQLIPVRVPIREQADRRRAYRTRTCSSSSEIPCQRRLRAGRPVERRRSAARVSYHASTQLSTVDPDSKRLRIGGRRDFQRLYVSFRSLEVVRRGCPRSKYMLSRVIWPDCGAVLTARRRSWSASNI
jgi:hypothetical protein